MKKLTQKVDIDEFKPTKGKKFRNFSNTMTNGTHFLKISTSPEYDWRIQKEHTNLCILMKLKDKGVRTPEVYGLSKTSEGRPYIVMENIPNLIPCGNLEGEQWTKAVKDFRTQIETMEEKGITPMDVSLYQNCAWIPEEQKVLFFDVEDYNTNNQGL